MCLLANIFFTAEPYCFQEKNVSASEYHGRTSWGNSHLKQFCFGEFRGVLVVLTIGTSAAVGPGSLPGCGTKILQALLHGQTSNSFVFSSMIFF